MLFSLWIVIFNARLQRVFDNVATVIRPTPPGTGVMYDARRSFVKHDVANDLAIFRRLIPTSITIALL